VKSCVYKIIQISTEKVYIGSTVNWRKRKLDHFSKLRKNCHPNRKLQNSFNKYGKDDFYFEIVMFCTDDLLRKTEQLYLDLIKPEFNISKDATAPMQGRKHTQSSKEKFKSRKYAAGKNHYLFGKRMPKSTVDKIILAKTGKKRSLETRKKMSETAKTVNAISRVDRSLCRKKIRDSEGNIFSSLVETSKFHGISVSSVCDVLKGRSKKTKKGITFEYL
jgi:group I intron endonuclease